MIVAQTAPLTPEEEAKRVVYNIIHNKAFVNLDMRAYTGKEIDVLIVNRYEKEWAIVQKAREKAGQASVPVHKVKKPKTQAQPRSSLPPCTPSLPPVSAPPTVI
jgi:hypothetical protein